MRGNNIAAFNLTEKVFLILILLWERFRNLFVHLCSSASWNLPKLFSIIESIQSWILYYYFSIFYFYFFFEYWKEGIISLNILAKTNVIIMPINRHIAWLISIVEKYWIVAIYQSHLSYVRGKFWLTFKSKQLQSFEVLL